jgi:hypothetical protein
VPFQPGAVQRRSVPNAGLSEHSSYNELNSGQNDRRLPPDSCRRRTPRFSDRRRQRRWSAQCTLELPSGVESRSGRERRACAAERRLQVPRPSIGIRSTDFCPDAHVRAAKRNQAGVPILRTRTRKRNLFRKGFFLPVDSPGLIGVRRLCVCHKVLTIKNTHARHQKLAALVKRLIEPSRRCLGPACEKEAPGLRIKRVKN